MLGHTIPEIIEGLNCLTVKQHHCAGCPYNPKPGQEWAYGCIRGQGEIIAEAQEALREAENEGPYDRRNLHADA